MVVYYNCNRDYLMCYRRKWAVKQADYENQIEQLHAKINNLEKAKARIQSELQIALGELDEVSKSFTLN